MRRASDNVGQQSVSDRRSSYPDTTSVGEAIGLFLRRLHPRATSDNVAADLAAWSIKSSTVAKMIERRSTPGWHLMLAMTCVYGPEFICAVVERPPEWVSDAHRAQRQRAYERRMENLKREFGVE